MNKQDKKPDKKEEAIAPREPAHKQEQIDTPPPKAVKGLKQQEEEEEVQYTAQGRERGKYRQYGDSQTLIEKIRSYRTERYPDSEIMRLLDNMPRRTYYNYVRKLQEQDKQIMEKLMKEHEEHVAEEMMIRREFLCQKLREVQTIIDNKNTTQRDKLQAIQQHITISDTLSNFTTNGRAKGMKAAENERYWLS
jgi:hypothetical protein